MPENTAQLPNRLSDELDRRLDEFDAAWFAGDVPDVETYLPDELRSSEIPPAGQWRRFVAELLTVDLEYRLRRGTPDEQPRIEDYFGRIPWMPFDELLLLELIPAEYMARLAHSGSVDAAEYERRFPKLRAVIAARLEAADADIAREQGPGQSEQTTDSFFAVIEPTVSGTSREGSNSADGSESADGRVHGMTREFGDYELQREIARGGMGVVYKAIQRSLKRTVAIKVILTGRFAEPEDLHRFRSEAEAAARLDHPGIVPIYEVGVVAGRHFFSMAYVGGPSLAALVAQHPLDPMRAATIIRDVADAMDDAHRHGVIHRDLKPANILMEGGRTPRVTDFGLARQTNVQSGVTVTGQVMGTPAYMPPEQALGHTGEIDNRSDIYSLGATLYCLLTGHPPFQAATPMQTIVQVVQQDPVPPRARNGDVPRDLENICLKCLHKSSRSRYQTAAALRDDLNQFLRGKPTVARPLSSLERVARFGRRNPGISVLLASVMLLGWLLASVSIRSSAQKQRASAQVQQALAESERRGREIERLLNLANEKANEAAIAEAAEAQRANEAVQATEQAVTARQDAEFRNYLLNLERIQQLWTDGRVKEARTLLANREDRRQWDDLRGWEWNYVAGLLNNERDRLEKHHKRSIQAVCWSPDGKRFASADQDGLIKVWDRERVRLSATLDEHEGWVRGVAFSNHGRQLLSIGNDGRVLLWNVDRNDGESSHRDRGILAENLNGADRAQIAISSDAGKWAWCDAAGNVTVGSLASTSPLANWSASNGPLTAMSFDASGSRLATADQTGTIAIRRTEDGVSEMTLDSQNGTVWAMAFGPDGERLVAGGANGWVQVWDTQTGKKLSSWNAHRETVYRLQFGDNADELLTCSMDQTIRRSSISKQSSTRVLRGHVGPVYTIGLSPNGHEILSGGQDGSLRLWGLGEDRIMLGPAGFEQVILPSFDGQRLLRLSRDTGGAADKDTLRSAAFEQIAQAADVPLSIADVRSIVRVRTLPGSIIAATSDEVVHMDAAGHRLATFPATGGNMHLLAAGESGSLLASADQQGRIRVYDVAQYSTRWEGRKFATEAGESEIAVLAFTSSEAGLVAIDRSGRAKVFDAALGHITATADLPIGPASLAASPHHNVIAVGGRDGVIRLRNSETLEDTTELRGHREEVYGLAFSPDGRRLASAGRDHTVRVWAPRQGDQVLKLTEHDQPVRSVFWSDDGEMLISVDDGGTVIRRRTKAEPEKVSPP